jgi:hypothetical protein
MKIISMLFLVLWMNSGWQTRELTHELKEAKLLIDLPNENWFLANKQESNGRIVYFFKREAIEDAEGRKIIPNIGVVIEDVEKDMDAVRYSALKRSAASFEVLEVFTHESGRLKFQNAVGYKGKYVDRYELDHSLYIIHAVNSGKGIQLICDATASVMEKVEGEFKKTLMSIRK